MHLQVAPAATDRLDGRDQSMVEEVHLSSLLALMMSMTKLRTMAATMRISTSIISQGKTVKIAMTSDTALCRKSIMWL
jgi:hypothetical protein